MDLVAMDDGSKTALYGGHAYSNYMNGPSHAIGNLIKRKNLH